MKILLIKSFIVALALVPVFYIGNLSARPERYGGEGAVHPYGHYGAYGAQDTIRKLEPMDAVRKQAPLPIKAAIKALEMAGFMLKSSRLLHFLHLLLKGNIHIFRCKLGSRMGCALWQGNTREQSG